MKSIYTKIGDKYYKVNQKTFIPSIINKLIPGTSTSVKVDGNNRYIGQVININTLEGPDTKSNSELYKEFSTWIIDKKIKSIDTLQDYYKVYIDYSIYQDNAEIEHSQIVRPLEVEDKAIILGVNKDNETVYRRVKSFNPRIDFRLRNPLPHGIIQSNKCRYRLKINNVGIFQEKNEAVNSIHNSIYDVPFYIPSSVINTTLDESMLVYSSFNVGVDIQDIDLDYIPRVIEISLNIVLTNFIVVYDDLKIQEIIQANIDADKTVVPPGVEPPNGNETHEGKEGTTHDDRRDNPGPISP